jgi:hypothetical protein
MFESYCFDGSAYIVMTVEEKVVHKRRTVGEKVGRVKYTLQVQKRILREIEEIKVMQRTIFAGLKGMFNFDQPLIERVCCKDEVDGLILQLLYEAGPGGVYPKDAAARLEGYKVTRHHVRRRLERMNKRLLNELGQEIAEKRGHRWALTSFAYEIWGETGDEEVRIDGS